MCCRVCRRDLYYVSIPRQQGAVVYLQPRRRALKKSIFPHRQCCKIPSASTLAREENVRASCGDDRLTACSVRRNYWCEKAYSDDLHNFVCSPWMCDIRRNIKWMYHWDGFVLSYNIIMNTICVDMFHCMFQRESVQRRWNFPTQLELTRRMASFIQTWLRFRCFSMILLTDRICSSPQNRNVQGSHNFLH